VEELRGRPILDGEQIITPQTGDRGVDLYVSTSSAGGGLQMMVTGVVKQMTGESAQRAALGAGAIVMDVIASNDGRLPYEKIKRIRHLRPDMILLSGGTDGGTTQHVVEVAELIAAAEPKARLGTGYDMPVIFAGNQAARPLIEERLGQKTALVLTENLRPTLERENLGPARDKIHELFMEHVMAHAPGYSKLLSWTPVPVMPTPSAVGDIIQTIAREEGITVVGVDIGGATTDVFSVFQGVFNRTVSANLGMSYSVSNVLAEAGIANVMRWVPFDLNEADLRNRIKNKMVRPTTIPQTLAELMVEQAISREALRLAFEQHKQLAVGLKGVQQERTISDTFDQRTSGATLIDLVALNLLVGSGGVLSHAPRRVQAALMLLDAFLPEGVTELAVDSIFMMPQLGVLASVHPKAATEVFHKDCLIRLGTAVAPWGPGREGEVALKASLTHPDQRTEEIELRYGELRRLPMPLGAMCEALLTPGRNLDLGEGKGKPIRGRLTGGVVGILFDCRGRRPFTLPEDRARRIETLGKWVEALDAYPVLQAALV
jgi:uncharacterized protein (TIGR01319 family)